MFESIHVRQVTSAQSLSLSILTLLYFTVIHHSGGNIHQFHQH